MAYKNKNKQRNYQKVWLQSKRKEWENIMHNLKINGCAICGYDECDAALVFHHTNPEDKKFGIRVAQFSIANKKITDEINKCILLCANCHSIIEYGEN